eukprot:TRINITY_DN4091_c0_g1_i2.p1 TRINITY_DN4091_c0_g1~~TRINITY_DN4091_c0_g1_i2.p1  ORF type:complete len:251 (+),score=21.71 TRINITY_DN4091_c0_g1_i2:497-1249(+)
MALQCLRNQVVVYCGFSMTRNQYSALTGFLVDDHTWDLGEGTRRVGPKCLDPPTRYIHNHECHKHMHGHHVAQGALCRVTIDGPKCKPTDKLPIGDRGCIGYSLSVALPHCARQCATIGRTKTNVFVIGYNMDFIMQALRDDSRVAAAANDLNSQKTKEPATRLLVHGFTARNHTQVPRHYHVDLKRWSERMRRGLKGSAGEWWDHFPMTTAATGYRSPAEADGTHTPLYVNLMHAQVLLNHLCNARLAP